MTPMGRIKHSKETGLRPVNQRRIARAIRRAVGMGMHPSVHHHPEILHLRNQRNESNSPYFRVVSLLIFLAGLFSSSLQEKNNKHTKDRKMSSTRLIARKYMRLNPWLADGSQTIERTLKGARANESD